MKTKEEHLKYCIGILERGDKIKDVIRYLNYQNVDEDTHDEIINKLYELLEEEKIKEATKEKKRKLNVTYNLIIGVLFMVAGLFFIRPFWNRGILIILPFLIFGYGVYKIINEIFIVKK